MGGFGLPRGVGDFGGIIENDEQPIPFAGLRGSRADRIDSVVKKAIDARHRALHKQGRKGAAQRLER
jgi:hypothetical protein